MFSFNKKGQRQEKMKGRTPHGLGGRTNAVNKKGKDKLPPETTHMQSTNTPHNDSSQIPSPASSQANPDRMASKDTPPPSTTSMTQYVVGMTDSSDGRIWICLHGNDSILHDTARSISEIFKGKYKKPWIGWSKVDNDVKDMWFEEFKKKYKWDSQYNSNAHKVWNHKCTNLVCDALKVVRSNRFHDQWLSNEVLEVIHAECDKPEYKEKCEKNKQNRTFDIGGCLHACGSISLSEHKRRLALVLGRDPSQPEVFKKINFRQSKNSSEPPKWTN